jgi:acetyl esterase/lipase
VTAPCRIRLRRDLVSGVALLALTACASSPSGPDSDLPLGATAIELDIAFCGGAHPAQRLDLYYPARSRGNLPLALHVHGGAWHQGDKTTGPMFTSIGAALIESGYAVASTNYRLAPISRWPASIEDVTCAVRHLRENAAEFGIDPQRIGVWGNSAGGHLAALLGVTDDFSGPGTSTRVRAVVALYGIHDLTASDTPLPTAFAIESAFGHRPGSGNPVLSAASPVTHVTPDDAPFLLIHGLEDVLVLPNQSEVLFTRLTDAGVATELVLVENAGHELIEVGGPIDPSFDVIVSRIVDFFDARL